MTFATDLKNPAKGKILTVTCDRKNCGMKFRSNALLTFHLQIHDNDVIKCVYCPWAGVMPYNYGIHMNTHFRNRIWKCLECPEKFYQSNDLKNHIDIKHERDFEKYSCDIGNCSFTTFSKKLLNSHKHLCRFNKSNV